MIKNAFALSFLLSFLVCLSAHTKEVKLKIVQTSDVHGNFFPEQLVSNLPTKGGLARVCRFVQQERQTYGDRLILLDNGDILQGHPGVYYYNYVDTSSPHLVSEIMNYMKYDACTVGNHDIETGHPVYNRWIRQSKFPVLGANVIDVKSNEPYLKPYVVIEREGVRVVVFGLVTPAIPVWVPQEMWKGLRFDDMEETARKWVPLIMEREKPDLLVGLFHSGQYAYNLEEAYRENASLEVARNVPGFDMVLIGHDHIREQKKVVNIAGDSVLVMNPANNALLAADVDVSFTLQHGKVTGKEITGRLVDVSEYLPCQDFMDHFAEAHDKITQFVSKQVGTFSETVPVLPAYFGSSAFIDLIHTLQLEVSGAEISLAAPLTYSDKIKKGNIFINDLFELYKYENQLYTILLSGRELKGVLEMSYALWTNRMRHPDDHLLLLKDVAGEKGMAARKAFRNFPYNFDSAAGIIYEVDVTKPKGAKVNIISMADGTPFRLDKRYRVAVNSYRGNGGGELLTKGAGISKEELRKRVVAHTDKDLRYYLMSYIEKRKKVSPRPLHQWKFVPVEWTVPAAERDFKLLSAE